MKLRIYLLLSAAMFALCVSAQARRHKQKASASKAQAVEEISNPLFEEMLPNTQKLFVIDSLVVDIDKVTDAIALPMDVGRLTTKEQITGMTADNRPYVYVNGFGNKCYYVEMAADSTFSLYTRDRLGAGRWSSPQRLEGFDIETSEIAFPYMSSDGTTLYFAAKSDEGIGGYDIYVTSFDVESGRLLKAENMGLPFNSDADDFLYVEDDADGIAWFATTRRQPEGKACVYTIALGQTRRNYNSDEIGDEELHNYAALTSIADTWTSEDERRAHIARLDKAVERANRNENRDAIHIVISDELEYTSLSDFKTDANRQLFESINSRQKELSNLIEATEQMRQKYHSASATERKKISTQILAAENRQNMLKESIQSDIKRLRRNELGETRK